jgi:hypothetical protein
MKATFRLAAAAALTPMVAAGSLFASAAPASAIVYCRAGVVVHGCVARPVHPVVYCTRVGYPKGCIVR